MVIKSIPTEAFNKVIYIRIIGKNELYIENFKRILEVNDNHIKISAVDCLLNIWGKSLKIQFFDSNEIIIKGFINKLEF